MLTTHIHWALSLRISKAIPLIPLLCLHGADTDNFSFLYIKKNYLYSFANYITYSTLVGFPPHHHHHRVLSLLVEHRATMKSFQALWSPAIPLTSFHDLPVFLISSSIVFRYVLFGLPLLLYAWGSQSNAVFSTALASLSNVCPIQFHFLLFIRISIGFCLIPL
jgi:hypothetical protein